MDFKHFLPQQDDDFSYMLMSSGKWVTERMQDSWGRRWSRCKAISIEVLFFCCMGIGKGAGYILYGVR